MMHMIYSGASSLSAHCALFIIDLRGSLIKFRNMLRSIGNLHSPWPTHTHRQKGRPDYNDCLTN